ncbi:MAG: FmdB family zinc ribbon protein [Burkholderiales bacterium]
MPIYAYRCESCGHAQDVLQKISDSPLTTCPACGAEQFKKQVTAAGFQLKGSGWYVTDFRGGSSGGKPSDASSPPEPSAAEASCPAQPAADASCDACSPSSGEASSTPASSHS